jgi:Tfp pilus assembly protein FimT
MRGHTLLELVAVLLLLALAFGAAIPAGGRLRDRAAVIAARESVAGLVAEARAAAVAHGGADVLVESGPWRAWYVAGDSVRRTLPIESELGVSVLLGRGRLSTEVHYDALGLGRVASETLVFTRGGQQSGLVLSAYGRVRRW